MVSGGADIATRAFEVVLGGSFVGYAIDVWKTRRSDRRDATTKAKTDAREDVREPLQIESLQQAARKEELALAGMLREQLLSELERVTAERDAEHVARLQDRAASEAREQLLYQEIAHLRDTIEDEREAADRRYSALLQRLEALQQSIPGHAQEEPR